MNRIKTCCVIAIALCSMYTHAQYGTPASLQAELKLGDDLVYADLPPACRTKVMAVSPQILENCGYEDHTIYR